jgi:hypothetical protein
LTPPPLVRAQVSSYPAPLIAETPLPSPTTSTGVVLQSGTIDWLHVCGPLFVPSPNSPSKLSPQHLTPPPLVRAQVSWYPALIAETPLRGAAQVASAQTATGVKQTLPQTPLSPNWP